MAPRPLAIRAHVLRAYYEVTFGKGAGAAANVSAAFADATFDEYLALRRIEYPGISKLNAAKRAPREDLRAVAASFPEEEPPEEPEQKVFDVSGKAVDLSKKKLPPGADTVVLHGAKTLRGFGALGRMKRLRQLWVRLCRAEFAAPAKRILVDEIDAGDCTPEFMHALLTATSARSIVWIDFRGKKPLDLAPLAAHRRMSRVFVAGPRLRNVSALLGLELEKLTLGPVGIDDSMRKLLTSAGSSLRELSLSNDDDISPRDLPFDDLSALERISICVQPTHREKWLNLAVERPTLRFDFKEAPPSVVPDLPELELEETHREVEILRVTKGKKLQFRIESDVAEAVGYPDSNGDLEDDLAPLAKRAKKKIEWGSEAGTLVATCSDIATCRWIIDKAVELTQKSKR